MGSGPDPTGATGCLPGSPVTGNNATISAQRRPVVPASRRSADDSGLTSRGGGTGQAKVSSRSSIRGSWWVKPALGWCRSSVAIADSS